MACYGFCWAVEQIEEHCAKLCHAGATSARNSFCGDEWKDPDAGAIDLQFARWRPYER
jgi:hypothetical protein